MANFFSDNDDLRFYFDQEIDWESLVRATESLARDEEGFQAADDALPFYRQVAEMVGGFAADEVAPHAAEIDREGVRFVDGEAVFPPRLASIFEKIRGLELHGMCVPRSLGGLNAPLLLYFVNTELLGRAEVSVMAHNGFHGGIAMALLVFSIAEGTTEWDPSTRRITRTRFGKEIEEIISGRAWGCMDITEPDAGSDMAALRAVGEQDQTGQWFVTGQKIFITSGHGKYHFVIARTEKAADGDDPFAGLGGLSMFLVPAWHEDESGRRVRTVTIDRLEEKLGHHGSVTASLSFDRAPAHLIGRRGEGFQHMLTLMNNARLGVGFESLGLCEAAFRMARSYAAERRSMGKTIDHHEIIADYLDEMRTDIQGLRALAMRGAWCEEMAQKGGLALRFGILPPGVEQPQFERSVKEWKTQARRLTPLLKYLASEKAVEMARRAVQILGGNGYMREYGAEKLLRDALVMPIYEGTSQIQALMAMKDTLGGIMKSPQDFLRRTAQARWRSLSARDPLERRVARLQALSLSAQNHLIRRTAADKLRSLSDHPITEWARTLTHNWDPKRDFALAMLHAERLTRLLADEAIAELLLDQCRRHAERREVLGRWLDRAEPRSRSLHDEITTMSTRLLRQLAEAAAPGVAAPGKRAMAAF